MPPGVGAGRVLPAGKSNIYSAVYSTPDSSKTCTLGACVGVDSACMCVPQGQGLLTFNREGNLGGHHGSPSNYSYRGCCWKHR